MNKSIGKLLLAGVAAIVSHRPVSPPT